MRARSNRRKAPARRPGWKLPRIRVNWRLLAIVPLIAGVCAGVAAALGVALDRPVRHLVVEAPFQRVRELQIEQAVQPLLARGFVSLDLAEVRESLRGLDWVEDASAWRRWPDTLVVRVSEHTAAARWNREGLLNVHGELFTTEPEYSFQELPSLAGPAGTEKQVAELYLAVRGRLAETHLALETLSMDDRGAVSLILGDGQQVRVGRENWHERLERFFAVVMPLTGGRFAEIDYVDLRYENGFAVGWRALPEALVAGNTEADNHG